MAEIFEFGCAYEFVAKLEAIIESRRGADPESSYTAKLLAGGPRKMSKKLGEESAELIIESMDDKDDLFLNEAADLLYHYLVLLHERGFALKEVEAILKERREIIHYCLIKCPVGSRHRGRAVAGALIDRAP
ncbi:MAG: phosphoribosyl-ATP diphosphatase [Bacteroidales bacterium]|nr:phosphoribosyl-ATP diphosphatase [Bacteroidales bacterium]